MAKFDYFNNKYWFLTRKKFVNKMDRLAYWFKKIRRKRRRNKIKKKLFLLSKININKLY